MYKFQIYSTYYLIEKLVLFYKLYYLTEEILYKNSQKYINFEILAIIIFLIIYFLIQI